MSRWFERRGARIAAGVVFVVGGSAVAVWPDGKATDRRVRVAASSSEPSGDDLGLDFASRATTNSTMSSVPSSSTTPSESSTSSTSGTSTTTSTTSSSTTSSSTTSTTSTTATPTTHPAPPATICGHDEPAPPLGEVVFSSEEGGDADIWTMGPDGSGRRKLISMPGADTDADLSPDGSCIVWLHSPQGLRKSTGDPPRDTEVMVARTDGTAIRALTPGPTPHRNPWGSGGYLNPRWSPDGSRILFLEPVAESSQNQTVYDALTIRPDGSHLEKLCGLSDLAVEHADWSPDGKQLVVDNHHYQAQYGGLWLFELEQCSFRRLTPVEPDVNAWWAVTYEPSWSVAGQIAYVNYTAISVIQGDGSGYRRIVPEAGERSGMRWSADGQRLYFVQYGSIVSVAADGTDLRISGPGMTPGT